jgi:hypothetical protein
VAGQRTRSTTRDCRELCARIALAVAVGVGVGAVAPFEFGCTSPKPAQDAAISAAPVADAAIARGRRRRRRTRVRAEGQVAQNSARTVDNSGSNNGSNSLAPQEIDEPEPPRPRITETGPMLPENIGPPPAQTLDMTGSGGEGPIGLGENDVNRALNPLLGRMGNCAAATTDDDGRGPHGRVSIRVRVRNDGRPIAARVTGGGGSSEFITCVRRVVASARFTAFRGSDSIVGWGFDVD